MNTTEHCRRLDNLNGEDRVEKIFAKAQINEPDCRCAA